MVRSLTDALASQPTVFIPLCLDPLTARVAEQSGFEFGYLSGGALGYSYAVSEALLTLTEVVDATARLVQRSTLGIVVDGGVGFGDAVHLARTIWEVEVAGAAAIEIEDQVAPKRVSHHRGIEHLIAAEDMVAKIETAVEARRSSEFLIIARTGAVKNESFEAALTRLEAYRAAGADVLMAMPGNDDQFRAMRDAIDAPLAAMTSLDTRTAAEWEELGWNLVIDPFTAQVLAFEAIRDAYRNFKSTGRTGADLEKLFATYRELPGTAGLEELYAIEDRTTER